MGPPKPAEVDGQTVYHGTAVPALGLAADIAQPFRVSVLVCAPARVSAKPTFYVGIEHRAWVGRRIRDQFARAGADYTKKNKPSEVGLVWPAANRAVEAYVFFALQATMPRGSCHRLGGWTQTSSEPSPLSCLVLEQSRRNLTSKCFRCGGDHWASRCNKTEDTCNYRCPGCGAPVMVTSRGQSLPAPAAAASITCGGAARRSVGGTSVQRPGHSTNHGRSHRDPPPPPKRVKVCGHDYSTLSWYLQNTNPGPRVCARVLESCAGRAVELKGGDSKSLAASRFARSPPYRAKELLPERERLPTVWTDTACQSVKKGEPIQLRKLDRTSGCRNVLWRLSDLEAVA